MYETINLINYKKLRAIRYIPLSEQSINVCKN